MSETPHVSTYPLAPREFEIIRSLVYDFCGVDLGGKQVLVGTRLSSKVRELGISSFTEYCKHLQQDGTGASFTAMVDALTTNHTSFLRERQHFDFLKKIVLPNLASEPSIAIWSSACSTGEEPYTIAFTLAESMGDAVLQRASILATDISTRVLAHARKGLYLLDQVKAFPQTTLKRCLLRGIGPNAGKCVVKPEFRSLIQFKQFNLLDDPSQHGPFHIIFCRNVMIYFDKATQETVVNRLTSRLAPGGYLFIGHSESLNGIRHSLDYVKPATYRKGSSSLGMGR